MNPTSFSVIEKYSNEGHTDAKIENGPMGIRNKAKVTNYGVIITNRLQIKVIYVKTI